MVASPRNAVAFLTPCSVLLKQRGFRCLRTATGALPLDPASLWKGLSETFRVGVLRLFWGVMFILFDCLLDIFSNYDIMYGKCAEISVLSYDCHTALTSPNGQPCFLI